MFDPQTHLIIIEWFPRLIGLIYLFVFGAFLFQMQGLFGSRGILPIERFLRFIKMRLGKRGYYYVPTVFWLSASDTAIMAVPMLGTVLSVLLMLGFYPSVILPIMYILHLSIVSSGQDFLSFGWEMFFLEITFNAMLLSWTYPPNLFVWISLNILIIRFHIQAGVVKLQSRDRSWQSLTALCYHYQTQPLPNTLAWYAHHLPVWFHKFSAVNMLFIELVVPFAVFGTEQMRLFAFICFFLLQYTIWVTGNYSYLNYLTVVLCSLLISDTYLEALVEAPAYISPTPVLVNVFVSLIGISLIILQLIRLWHHFFFNKRLAWILDWIQPLHIVNRYGIFAVMTTERYEIVIEGSDDGKNWKEYTFRYKPSELDWRPRRIAPYQPRIDWQAWFLPFSYFEDNNWFQNLISRLFENSPHVLKLIRHNPFPDVPPNYIRALTYLYEFSDPQTKKETGQWWKRTLVGYYSPKLKRSA